LGRQSRPGLPDQQRKYQPGRLNYFKLYVQKEKFMKKSEFVFCSLLFTLFAVSTAFSQDGPKGKSGEVLYKQYCAGCHPKGGNVIKSDKVLKGSSYLKDEQKFAAWLRKPVQPMPPFPPAKISDAEAKDLLTYILEQLKGDWK
jgi:cytochrome c6